MSIAESFYTFVAANSNITSALANSSSIYPGYIPQNHDVFPSMTYQLSEDEDWPLLNGDISDSHLAEIEVRIYDNSFKSVNDVATTVKAELIGYRGGFGAHTADLIRKVGEFSLPEETETGLHGVRLNFQVNYY